MFLRRFIRRHLFTLCGTDIDVHKQDSECENVPSTHKAVGDRVHDEILPVKRERAMTVETERSSCYSARNSCSSDDECPDATQFVSMSIPTITLGQVRLSEKELLEEEFIDPISLEPLREPMYSYKCAPSGNVINYNLSSIVEYLLTTGDFRDPISRSELKEDDIISIDAAVVLHQLGLPPLLEKFHDRSSFLKIENRNNTIRGLESCMGEVICDIMTNIETSSKNGTYYMSLLFSELDRPFTELKELSIEEAYHSLQTWIAFLKGPPKKPTKNLHGRLKYAISFLENQWTPRDQELLDAVRKNNLCGLKNN